MVVFKVNFVYEGFDYYVFNVMLNLYDVNGKIQFDVDKCVVWEYFLQYVNQNMVFFYLFQECLDYFVEKEYYEGVVIEKYLMDFIQKFNDFVYLKKFCFEMFFGVFKYYMSYMLKIFDGKCYFECFEDCVVMIVFGFVDGDEKFVVVLVEEIIFGCFQLVILMFFNVGKVQCGEFVSCFLFCIEDNMELIVCGINFVFQFFKCGGGVVLLLLNICELGVLIKQIENQFLGIIFVMKFLEDSFSYVNQFGVCQGVGVVYFNVYYFDIMCFFDIKCENVDEKICIKMLLFGVVVLDIIFEFVKNDEDMYLFLLYDVEKVYGVLFGDILVIEKYCEMVDDLCIKKMKINVCEFFQIVVEIQFEFGYLYVMFEDMVNKVNLIKGWINMFNFCSEILQVNMLIIYNDDLLYKEIGKDIFCNFGLMNIVLLMDVDDFGQIVEIVICVFIVVSDQSYIGFVCLIEDGNDCLYVIGFGQMNLYGYLVCEYVFYGFEEGIDFMNIYFYMVLFYVLCVLNNFVIECGMVFDGFEDFIYVFGEFFDKYIDCVWVFEIEKVKELFVGKYILMQEDWVQLKVLIQKYGIYNQNLQVVLLIGLILYINNFMLLIYLIVLKIEICKEGKFGCVYYLVVFMMNDNLEYYQDVYEIGYEKVIDIYVVVMQYVDQGLLLMFFFKDIVIMCDINKVQIYVWCKGIKMIYYICLCQLVFEGIDMIECVLCMF